MNRGSALRFRRAALALGVATAAAACSSKPSAAGSAGGDTAASAAAAAGLSSEEATRRAREFVARHPAAAAAVYLDSAQAEAVDSLWRVTFRRRALVAPAVLTVDVHRRTGAMRFPGDE